MGNKSKTALLSLVIGITCFLNVLNLDKAVIAILLGLFGLKEIELEAREGKGFAYAGIVLGCLYIVVLTVLLIVYGPQFIQHIKMMSGK